MPELNRGSAKITHLAVPVQMDLAAIEVVDTEHPPHFLGEFLGRQVSLGGRPTSSKHSASRQASSGVSGAVGVVLDQQAAPKYQ